MNNLQVMKIITKVAESVEPFGQAKIAAGLVYKNEILSIGTNKNKSHPFQKKYASNSDAIYLHAETNAIYTALKRNSFDVISKATLYISRVKWNGDAKNHFICGLAKPCIGCQRAISTFNIKRVCYTLDEEGVEWL
jgi:deoxycytidylate deaminase